MGKFPLLDFWSFNDIFFGRPQPNNQPTKKEPLQMQLELFDTGLFDNSDTDFRAAIANGNLNWARDAVAQFLPDTTGKKMRAYKTLLVCALELGQLSVALEVGPFCGYRFSRADFEDCLKKAIAFGNLTETLLCKSRLRDRFTWQEALDLRAAMEQKEYPLPYAFKILDLFRCENIVATKLAQIIIDKVELWKLSEEERILLEMMKIVD